METLCTKRSARSTRSVCKPLQFTSLERSSSHISAKTTKDAFAAVALVALCAPGTVPVPHCVPTSILTPSGVSLALRKASGAHVFASQLVQGEIPVPEVHATAHNLPGCEKGIHALQSEDVRPLYQTLGRSRKREYRIKYKCGSKLWRFRSRLCRNRMLLKSTSISKFAAELARRAAARRASVVCPRSADYLAPVLSQARYCMNGDNFGGCRRCPLLQEKPRSLVEDRNKMKVVGCLPMSQRRRSMTGGTEQL